MERVKINNNKINVMTFRGWIPVKSKIVFEIQTVKQILGELFRMFCALQEKN
jgi:hypothetical protein